MEKMTLGRTGLHVSKSGFGALPIQRVGMEEARDLLRKAYEGSIDFFDTARGYTDSEEKIGHALADVRNSIIIATKSHGTNAREVREHLETSLRNLKTDHVDILQLHNPAALPDPGDPAGPYAALAEAKKQGLIRFIGITNHRLNLALEAVRSGLYDTVQFPLSSLSSEKDLILVEECKKHNVGFIAMKALSGGLVTNAAATFAWLRQYANVLPIWGVQRLSELVEFLELEKNPPVLDDAMKASIEKDRQELSGAFCRGCGYCLPCPAEIPIPMAARLSYALRRMPSEQFLSDGWKAQMDRIRNCRECGACKKRCPYGLDTPALLKNMLADYENFYASHMHD